MTAVITVPSSLDDLSFELVLEQLAAQPADARVIVDARHCTFASPYGLTALLTLAQTRAERPTFLPPEDQDKVTYWARAGFFRFAEELYDIQGAVPRPRTARESDVLLEVTPIVKSDDVHTVVERIKDKATQILTNKLHLISRATMGFTMTLSEACQNIVEHAGRGGWVMVQVYQYRKRLGGRLAVVIAVCDAGVGFRRSLESSPRRPLTDRWDDGFALETAVINGISRYSEAGRGQGLKGIRGYVHRWDGKLSVRSGTARIALVPPWDDDVPRRDNLAPFAGAQLQITIPEKSAA
ncbi:MAG TPA: ATP-binding protein [Gemmatimonadaceae bacterium]|nr:ATP-binding protein [Gemmatimonadaceae bacterium]